MYANASVLAASLIAAPTLNHPWPPSIEVLWMQPASGLVELLIKSETYHENSVHAVGMDLRSVKHARLTIPMQVSRADVGASIVEGHVVDAVVTRARLVVTVSAANCSMSYYVIVRYEQGRTNSSGASNGWGNSSAQSSAASNGLASSSAASSGLANSSAGSNGLPSSSAGSHGWGNSPPERPVVWSRAGPHTPFDFDSFIKSTAHPSYYTFIYCNPELPHFFINNFYLTS